MAHSSNGSRSRVDRAARVVCHVVAEVPFLVVALVQVAQGWRPTLDDAVISIRSWAVLTSRGPMLGEFTQASTCARHTAFNPGPVLFWMLALPVRVDPGHGVLWGAAIFCAVAMALCVEAAWAVRGATGALAVGGFTVVLAATQPDVLVNPAWDPHFALVWFAATCMLAWVVGTGRLRWWPVLVLTASIASQTHLVYALPAALLAILAPLPALLPSGKDRRGSRDRRSAGARRSGEARRRAEARWSAAAGEGWTWAVMGLVVGAACWAVPIIQQLRGHPGNVTVLLRCVGNRQVMGDSFGLQTLASAVVPPPLWFHRPSGGTNALLRGLTAHSAWVGIAVLALLGAVMVAAWVLRHKDLAVLAGVALLAAGATVWEIGHQPSNVIVSLFDADIVLWPVGMLVWGVAALAVEEGVIGWGVGARLRRRSEGADVPRGAEAVPRLLPRRQGRALLFAVTGIVLVGGSVNAAILTGGAMNRAVNEDGGRGAFRGVSEAARAAERLVPRGPMVLAVSGHDAYVSLDLIYGTLWVLISQGHDATVGGIFADAVTPPVHAVPGEPFVDVTVREDGSVAGATLGRHR
jgi:hypothetical protein